MKKSEYAQLFRERLVSIIEKHGANHSKFAKNAEIDRSTLSQLLSSDNVRLPRIDTLLAISKYADVSVDWLLGLSQEGQLATDVMDMGVEMSPGGGSPIDEQLEQWHAEASGYKIRYVPLNLPDLLKNEDVIRFEYQHYEQIRTEGKIEQAEFRLAYSRHPETDMEVCSPIDSLEGFARGEGLWRTLAPRIRKTQLDSMIELVDELYPTFRWFLFDGLKRYCAPMTVFGPNRAAIYLGHMFVVFNSTEHIRTLTRHFEYLIRVAVMQPPDVPKYLKRLRNAVR